jgi:hypothetical protein
MDCPLRPFSFWSFFSFVSNIRASMLRRGLGVAAVLLVFASPARAGTLGLADVRAADGTLPTWLDICGSVDIGGKADVADHGRRRRS